MASNESSLFSVSPPVLPDNAENTSDSSISENIVSSNGSVENDRSFQEIIITNIMDEENSTSPQSPPIPVSHHDKSDSPSLISLNALENFQNLNAEVRKNVQSILDEILRNEQFKSTGSHSNTLSLNSNHILSETSDIFRNIFSDAHSLNSADRSLMKMQEFEDMLAAKDNTIAELSAENDSLKELISSNPSSATEYKPYFDDRYVEFQTAIAHRDELIQQLTDSLQQSLSARELQQKESNEKIISLQQKLQELQENIPSTGQALSLVKEEEDKDSSNLVNLDEECSKLECTLSSSQMSLMKDLKCRINEYLQHKIRKSKSWHDDEMKTLKNKLDMEKAEHENEVARLRELLNSVKCGSTEIMELRQELEASHAKEMEKMRIYYEKKCLDIEKK